MSVSDNWRVYFHAGIAVLILWVFHFITVLLDVDPLGLEFRPGDVSSLPRVFIAPFFHADVFHLLVNSPPLLMGLGILFVYYRRIAWWVLVAVYLSAGLCVWLFASPDIQFGLTPFNTGLCTFLLVGCIIRLDIEALSLTLLTIWIYFGLVFFPFSYFLASEFGQLMLFVGLLVIILTFLRRLILHGSFFFKKKSPTFEEVRARHRSMSEESVTLPQPTKFKKGLPGELSNQFGRITWNTLRNCGIDPLASGLLRFIPEAGIFPWEFMHLPIAQILEMEKPERSAEATRCEILFSTKRISGGLGHYVGIYAGRLLLPDYEKLYPNDRRLSRALDVKERWVQGRSKDSVLLKAIDGAWRGVDRVRQEQNRIRLEVDESAEKEKDLERALFAARMIIKLLDHDAGKILKMLSPGKGDVLKNPEHFAAIYRYTCELIDLEHNAAEE